MKFIYYLFISLGLTLFSCEDQFISNFDFDPLTGEKYVCEIEMNTFFSSFLKDYTDPKIRSIISRANETTKNATDFFIEFERLVDEENYDIVKYFKRANEELFGETNTPEAVFDVINELFDEAVQANFEHLNYTLATNNVLFNLYIDDRKNLVVESAESAYSSEVNSAIFGTTDFHFFDLIYFRDAFEDLLFIDSIYTHNNEVVIRDSLTIPKLQFEKNNPYEINSFFNGILSIIPFDNPSPQGPLRNYWGTALIGYSKAKDTALINAILTDDPAHTWERCLWQQYQEDSTQYKLMLAHYPTEEHAINAADILGGNYYMEHRNGFWAFEFGISYDASRKLYHYTRKKQLNTIAVTIDGQILFTMFFEEPMNVTVLGFSSPDYTQEYVEEIAHTLNQLSPPYPMQVK